MVQWLPQVPGIVFADENLFFKEWYMGVNFMR